MVISFVRGGSKLARPSLFGSTARSWRPLYSTSILMTQDLSKAICLWGAWSLVLFSQGAAAADLTPVRVWKDSTGQHELKAALVKIENGEVFFRREDGSVVQVPITRLSPADQDAARK